MTHLPVLRAYSEKFWGKVWVRGKDECWWWLGGTITAGYGRFYIGAGEIYAHIFAWRISNPSKRIGKRFILHSCDIPHCVNPAHLRPGTQKDNMQDARRRKRLATGNRHGTKTCPDRVARGDCSGARLHPEAYPKGEDRPNSKLNPPKVREIRKAKGRLADIGKQFGISFGLVGRIKRREAWRWV